MCIWKKSHNEMVDDEKKYRDHIVENIIKSQETFDKVLLTLTSGSLGFSITLIGAIFGFDNIENSCALYIAWVSWTLSLLILLISHYFSVRAWEKTITQFDEGSFSEGNKKEGEPFTSWVDFCNTSGLLLYIFGIIGFMVFLFYNLIVI